MPSAPRCAPTVVSTKVLAAVLLFPFGPCAGLERAPAAPPVADARAERLPSDLLGPFVRLSDGRILAIDGDAATTSADEGRTWQDRRIVIPSAGDYQKTFKISPER